MTFVAAFKWQNSAYIFADCAVTTEIPIAESTEQSSFGEVAVREPKRFVAERVLKIVRIGDLALALAGDGQLATRIAATVKANLSGSMDVHAAFVSAVRSHAPFNHGPSAKLIVATPK